MSIDLFDFDSTEDPDFIDYQERFLDSIGFCLQKESPVPSVRRGRPRRYTDNAVMSVRLPKKSIVRLYEYCKRNNCRVPDVLNEFINSL